MSGEKLDAIVVAYLRKRGYSQAEAKLMKEANIAPHSLAEFAGKVLGMTAALVDSIHHFIL